MGLVMKFSVVFAMYLALMGCGSSPDKQVSQVSETLKQLQQETAQSKEAIGRLQKEISQARESISKVEQEITQIGSATSKLDQDQASFKADQDKTLAQLKETLTKLQQEITQVRESSSKMERKISQSIRGAVRNLEKDKASLKAEQDKGLELLKENLTELQQEISHSKESGKPGEEKTPPKENPEKPPTQ